MPAWYQRANWRTLRALMPPVLRRLGVEAEGLGLIPEPPFLLLADHSNALDPYVIGALTPYPIRYMANIEGVSPLRAALASLVGAYGRRKGATDLGALRETDRCPGAEMRWGSSRRATGAGTEIRSRFGRELAGSRSSSACP